MLNFYLGLPLCSKQDSAHSPVLYPISILLHVLPWQNPKTPKSTPPNEARGICLMIGVEITDMSSKTNAASSSTDRGVAGLNILKSEDPPSRNDCGCRRPQDAASGVKAGESSMRKLISQYFDGMLRCLTLRTALVTVNRVAPWLSH